MAEEYRSDRQVSDFDRKIGSLDGRPDVVKTAPSTQRVTEVLIGGASYIIQTFREGDAWDWIFVERISGEGHIRLVLPPKVANCIARQRKSVTHMRKSKAATRTAQERKDAGIVPFVKTKEA